MIGRGDEDNTVEVRTYPVEHQELVVEAVMAILLHCTSP